MESWVQLSPTDPYAPERAEHDSAPNFLVQATYDRDGSELTAEFEGALATSGGCVPASLNAVRSHANMRI